MEMEKLKEMIERSVMTTETKRLVLDLLGDLGDPEVREEIMRAVDLELELNEDFGDEAERILVALDRAGENGFDQPAETTEE
jgi:hypothetical protein